jgi:sulfonate transport system ATP-binding protein
MSIQPALRDFGLADLVRHEAEVGQGEIVAVFDGSASAAGTPTSQGMAVLGPGAGLFPWLTVSDNLVFGREGLTPFAQDGLVANALARVGLGDIGRLLPDELSPFERHGVALARLFLTRPPLLLLTQPFAGLDPAEEAHLFERLAALRRESGLRVLLAPRDLDQALLAADRILLARPAGPVVAGFVNLRRRPQDRACACRGRLRSEIARAIRSIAGAERGLASGWP